MNYSGKSYEYTKSGKLTKEESTLIFKSEKYNTVIDEDVTYSRKKLPDKKVKTVALTKTRSDGKEEITEKYTIRDNKDNILEDFDGFKTYKSNSKFETVVIDGKNSKSLKVRKESCEFVGGSKSETLIYKDKSNKYLSAGDITLLIHNLYKEVGDACLNNNILIDGNSYTIMSLLFNSYYSIFNRTQQVSVYSSDKYTQYTFFSDNGIQLLRLALSHGNIISVNLTFTKNNNRKNVFSQMSEILIDMTENKYRARDIDVSESTPLNYSINQHEGMMAYENHTFIFTTRSTVNYISEIKKKNADNIVLTFSTIKETKIVEQYEDAVTMFEENDIPRAFPYSPVDEYTIGGEYQLENRKPLLSNKYKIKSVEKHSNNFMNGLVTTYSSYRVGKNIIPEKYHYAITNVSGTKNGARTEYVVYTDFVRTKYIETHYDKDNQLISHDEYDYNDSEDYIELKYPKGKVETLIDTFKDLMKNEVEE